MNVHEPPFIVARMSTRLLTSLVAGVLFASTLLAVAAAVPAQNPAQGASVRAALESAERGAFAAARVPCIATHPLFGWVEYAALRRDVDTLSNTQAQAFLARYR